MFNVRTENRGAWDIIGIDGLFTLRNCSVLRPILNALLRRNARVALDFSYTKLIDSSAISLLIDFREKIRAENGLLVFIQPNEEIKLVLSIVEFEKTVRFYTTREEFDSDVANVTTTS